MSTTKPVDIYLDTLDANVTATNLTWDAQAQQITGFDATATIYVKTSDMKNTFWFGLDSNEVVDSEFQVDAGKIMNTDINFYLNYEANKDTPLFATDAFAAMLTENAIGGSTYNGKNFTPDEFQVPQDYARYVAYKLFGIYNAVDIFNNESTFAESLYSIADSQINNVHNKLMKAIDVKNAIDYVTATGSSGTDATDLSGAYASLNGQQFVTNKWDTHQNLGFQILKQLEKGDPLRFTTDLQAAGALVKTTIYPFNHDVYKMPFRDGDSVSFKVTVKPSATQVTALIPDGSGSSISIPDRVYRIKYLLVSDDEYASSASFSNSSHHNNDIGSRYSASNITPITAYASVTPALPLV